ncbi:alpha/beta hydrolase [Polynucleobacter sp. AP-Nickl1-40-C4]|uniref:alpha/beta hydrolase n=1 Tax=Polynucleobacter sp. AP-Nickl1-40-C4 TaxID=3108275 RepID=UPI002B223CC2|nr:alpha/beta fold hydrolase [Polynucleobacter sp. AP-Nickl1-40-C4]MEA9567661.1 alpha/beta fold hydrolase [Polynucleobacter sp. AP-Nickl1-40-C4]
MNDYAHNDDNSPLIVLFHGLSSSPLEFNFLSSQLTAAGYRVNAPTIAGYSFGGKASSWKFWLKEAIKHVQDLQKTESKPISLGGISLGSTLALAVASELNDILGVVALSTTLKYNGWAIPWYRSLIPFGMMLGLGDHFKYRERDPFGIKNPQIRAYIKRVLSSQDISAVGGLYMSLRHMHEGNKLCKYVTENLSRVSSSVLTIHAIDDEIANTFNAELVGEKSNASLLRQIYLGNSYHMITVDNERETVAYETQNFLDLIYGKIEPIPSEEKILAPELQRFLRNLNRID